MWSAETSNIAFFIFRRLPVTVTDLRKQSSAGDVESHLWEEKEFYANSTATQSILWTSVFASSANRDWNEIAVNT